MKYTSNEHGVLPILVAVLAVLLIGMAGVAIYNVTRNQGNRTASNSPSPSAAASQGPHTTPTFSPGSDQALIKSAIDARCNAMTGETDGSAISADIVIQADSAKTSIQCIGVTGGEAVILKKSNGTWAIVWTGQEAPGKEIGVKYGLPTNWYDPNH